MPRKKLSLLGEILTAKALAKMHHEGQTYAGKPYFDYHIEGVVKNVWLIPNIESKMLRNRAACVAWMHDLVEDTPVSLAMLRRRGFSKLIVDAVDAITKRDGELYYAYMRRVRSNEIATIVKRADIAFNLSNSILEGNRDRIAKYVEAEKLLH